MHQDNSSDRDYPIDDRITRCSRLPIPSETVHIVLADSLICREYGRLNHMRDSHLLVFLASHRREPSVVRGERLALASRHTSMGYVSYLKDGYADPTTVTANTPIVVC